MARRRVEVLNLAVAVHNMVIVVQLKRTAAKGVILPLEFAIATPPLLLAQALLQSALLIAILLSILSAVLIVLIHQQVQRTLLHLAQTQALRSVL